MNASAGRCFAVGKCDGLFHALDDVLEYGHGVMGIDKLVWICKNNLMSRMQPTRIPPRRRQQPRRRAR
jgi:hypothetical protein